MSALLHRAILSLDAQTVSTYLKTLDAHALAALRHGQHIGYLMEVFSKNIQGPGPDIPGFLELTSQVANVLIEHELGSLDEACISIMMGYPQFTISILQKSTQYDLDTCVDGMRNFFYVHTRWGKTNDFMERLFKNYKAILTAVIKTWKKRNRPNNYFEDNYVFRKLVQPPPPETEEPNLSLYKIEKEVVEDHVRSRERLYAARRPLFQLNEGLELHRLSNHKARHDGARHKGDHVTNYLRAEHNQREIASYIDQEPIARKKKKGKKHSGGTKRKKVRK